MIIVADEDGVIESCNSLGGCTEGDILAKTGGKRIFALANGPSPKGWSSLEDVYAATAELGEWNDPDNEFIMSGETECCVTGDRTIHCPMTVERYVSRITLKELNNELPEQFGNLIVENIIISNATGDIRLDGTAHDGTWYNKMGLEEADSPNCTIYSVETRLFCGESLEESIRLYSYPNPTEEDVCGVSDYFTPRYTRMVISVLMNGEEYFYPISIQQPKRNRCYDIYLPLMHPGGKDPDIPIDPAAICLKVVEDG